MLVVLLFLLGLVGTAHAQNLACTGCVDSADLGDALDFSADTSFAIPSGTAKTASATGQITVDTDAQQLVYYGGTATQVLDPTNPVCMTIENVVDADDNYYFWIAPASVTITYAACYCDGANCGDTASFTLEDNSGNAMTGNPTCATTTGSATWQAITGTNTLTSGEGLRFDVTSLTANGKYTLCFKYTFSRG